MATYGVDGSINDDSLSLRSSAVYLIWHLWILVVVFGFLLLPFFVVSSEFRTAAECL